MRNHQFFLARLGRSDLSVQTRGSNTAVKLQSLCISSSYVDGLHGDGIVKKVQRRIAFAWTSAARATEIRRHPLYRSPQLASPHGRRYESIAIAGIYRGSTTAQDGRMLALHSDHHLTPT